MGCCGEKRVAARERAATSPERVPPPQPQARKPANDDEQIRLEPREKTTLYARGAGTGRAYVFTDAAPEPLVDPADVPALLASGLFRVSD
jgi:hypothetical protein